MASVHATPNDTYSLAYAAHNPNFLQINQASVTNVSTTQMLGIGNVSSLVLTPVMSTVVEFKIGCVAGFAAADTAQLVPSYGTGAAPINGAATAGTQVGSGALTRSAAAGDEHYVWQEVIITGLTIGTAYWFDLEAVFAAGTLTVSNVVAIVREV
jgi:hypothetical protein